jgi:hypothetical protein
MTSGKKEVEGGVGEGGRLGADGVRGGGGGP